MEHTSTGKVYVGQRKLPIGKNPDNDNYHGSGKIWKKIYKKHSDECNKKVLAFAENKEDANKLEIYFISLAREKYGDLCVNIADGGTNYIHKVGEFHHTEKTREKMSIAHKGKPKSEEWKNNIRISNTGKKIPEDVKIKIANSNKGNIPWNKGKRGIYSEEVIKKMRDAALKRENNPMKGKHHSEEAKAKMRAAWQKRKLSSIN